MCIERVEQDYLLQTGACKKTERCVWSSVMSEVGKPRERNGTIINVQYSTKKLTCTHAPEWIATLHFSWFSEYSFVFLVILPRICFPDTQETRGCVYT